MKTACLLDVFDREMRCEYKGRIYKVRDNGAIYRLHKKGCRASKCDDIWTFGTKNPSNGYMILSGRRVHQIVCTAFHGEAPYPNMVVDHIDTNRCNNRPENLRWVTRLENALNNPITRARIENIFGSIEAFLANPSILRGHERLGPNFHWMRTVSVEEARASLERLTNWAKEHPKPQGGSLGEWVFQERKPSDVPYTPTPYRQPNPIEIELHSEPQETKSLTPNVIQLDWKNPAEFPCCPQQVTDKPLETYLANLKEGEVFCKNDYGESTILKYGLEDSDNLWVMCRVHLGWKTHAMTRITFKDGIFYHENMGVYDIGDEPYRVFDLIMTGEIS